MSSADIIDIVNVDEIYLDYAAATPMADFVLASMQPYLTYDFYNPSSPYAPAVKVRRVYEAAKQRLAETFGAKGDEIIITAGATESINLAFSSARGHVITSSIEHPAVLESAKRCDYSIVEPSQNGRISPDSIKSVITPETQLISIALANNELGTVQPIHEISQVVADVRRARQEGGSKVPLLFHCDASQGFDQIDVHVARLGVDLLTLNAGKMYGPKQVGLLWVRRSVVMHPLIVGGGQEYGLRSGTENVAGTIGFSEAAVYARKHQRATNARLRELRNKLQEELSKQFVASIVLGSSKYRLPGHLSISFPGIDAERIIFMLERDGIYVSTGSACSANKHSASHVLVAIGLDEPTMNGSLRITLGRHTTRENIIVAAEKITEAVRFEYQRMEKGK